MKVKIANIVCDDKFIDGIMEPMNWLNDKWCLDYIFVANKNPYFFKYIRNVDKIQFVQSDKILSFLVEKQYDAVFIHCLPSMPINLIPQIDKKIKVFWFAWGYDIYQRPEERPFINIPLIKKETQKELDKYKRPEPVPAKQTIKDYIRPIKYKLFGTPSERIIKQYHNAINRVDYFSGVLEYEYDLMKSVKGFRAERVVFKYVSLQYFSMLYEQNLYRGNNILIGNSAASTNNHLDIIPYLQKLNLEGRKIVIPLSYCNTKEYVEDVANAYVNAFGDKVVVLKDFISFQDYSGIIESCSIGIFYMERQQAIGNVNLMLRNGCKVFLSETNLVHSYYKSIGIKIFSVQRDLVQSEIDSPLIPEEIESNRDVLRRNGNKDKYIQHLTEIYKCVISNSKSHKKCHRDRSVAST